MTHNGFTRIDSYHLTAQNGFLKFDSNQLTTQKASEYFDSNQLVTQKGFPELIQIDSWLKKTLEYWFESTVDFVEPFRTFTQFCWPFWGISRNSLTFFRLSLNFVDLFWAFIKYLDSNQLMTRAVSRKTWIDSTNDSSGFPGVDSESTHDSSGFPRWWFRLTHDSKRFPFFSIQISSWLKRKAFDS